MEPSSVSVLMVAAFLALGLAGCLAGESDNPIDVETTEAPTAPASAVPDPDLGSIEGRVQDEEGIPLAGAVIQLDQTGRTASTDAAGGFAFHAVKPGLYRLTASAASYAPSSMALTVRPGEVATVDIVVTQAAIREPYVALQIFDGHWECGVVVYSTVVACPDSDFTRVFSLYPDANYTAMLWEIAWTPGSAATTPSKAVVSLDTKPDENSDWKYNCGYWYGNPPPVRVLVRAMAMGHPDHCQAGPPLIQEVRYVATPMGILDQAGTTGTGVILAQRFQVYATVSHFFDLPDDMTSIEEP